MAVSESNFEGEWGTSFRISTYHGKKGNVHFIIQNIKNVEKRKKNKQSSFPDDCVIWDSSSNGSHPSSTIFSWMTNNQSLANVFLFKYRYYTTESGLVLCCY